MNADEPRQSFIHPTIRNGEFLVCDDEARAAGWPDVLHPYKEEETPETSTYRID